MRKISVFCFLMLVGNVYSLTAFAVKFPATLHSNLNSPSELVVKINRDGKDSYYALRRDDINTRSQNEYDTVMQRLSLDPVDLKGLGLVFSGLLESSFILTPSEISGLLKKGKKDISRYSSPKGSKLKEKCKIPSGLPDQEVLEIIESFSDLKEMASLDESFFFETAQKKVHKNSAPFLGAPLHLNPDGPRTALANQVENPNRDPTIQIRLPLNHPNRVLRDLTVSEMVKLYASEFEDDEKDLRKSIESIIRSFRDPIPSSGKQGLALTFSPAAQAEILYTLRKRENIKSSECLTIGQMVDHSFKKYTVDRNHLEMLILRHGIEEVEPRINNERRYSPESQARIEAILEKRRIDLKDALSPHTYKRDEVAEALAAVRGKSKKTAFGNLSKSTALLRTAYPFTGRARISFYDPSQIPVIEKELGVEGLEQKILEVRKKKPVLHHFGTDLFSFSSEVSHFSGNFGGFPMFFFSPQNETAIFPTESETVPQRAQVVAIPRNGNP